MPDFFWFLVMKGKGLVKRAFFDNVHEAGNWNYSPFLNKEREQSTSSSCSVGRPYIVREDTRWKSYAFTSLLDCKETLIWLTNYKTFQITDL